MLLSDVSGRSLFFWFVFLSTSVVGVGGIFKSPPPPMAVLFRNLPGREHMIMAALYSSGDVGEPQAARV